MKNDSRTCVLALGNFDGVHRGHQAVVRSAIGKARELGVASAVFTMEPHPRSVLRPDLPPFRLTLPETRERILRSLGVDEVITLEFTPKFAETSAEDFVEKILLEKCRAIHVVAGYDFVFGRGRSGNIALLKEILGRHGAGVTELQPVCDSDGNVLSSSRVRDSLRSGDVETAARVLGRLWAVQGKVVAGDMKGRLIGFPTANVCLGDYLRPQFGVYAIMAGRAGEGGRKYHGVANIGRRPTVDGKHELLEFHLFDFDRDIYGEEWSVELAHFIRPEARFSSIEELGRQIGRDADAAREFFARPPLSAEQCATTSGSERLYGRHKGRPLNIRRSALMREFLPAVEIRQKDLEKGLDPRQLFPGDVEEIWLEVGFGGGEHLAAQAAAHGNVGFMGCEPFVNGVASLLDHIEKRQLGNIRVFPGDARKLMDALPPDSVNRCFVLFPDPWPKKRHAERRFAGGKNLDRLARIMRRGGELRLATDVAPLAAWMREQMLSRPEFRELFASAVPPADWVATRYEQKGIKSGRSPMYMGYERL